MHRVCYFQLNRVCSTISRLNALCSIANKCARNKVGKRFSYPSCIERYDLFFNCNMNFLNRAATLNIHVSSRSGNPFHGTQTNCRLFLLVIAYARHSYDGISVDLQIIYWYALCVGLTYIIFSINKFVIWLAFATCSLTEINDFHVFLLRLKRLWRYLREHCHDF